MLKLSGGHPVALISLGVLLGIVLGQLMGSGVASGGLGAVGLRPPQQHHMTLEGGDAERGGGSAAAWRQQQPCGTEPRPSELVSRRALG